MADPFRLRLMKALQQIAETVGVDDDYPVSMVGRTFRGRIKYGESDPIPMAAILQDPVQDQPISNQHGMRISDVSYLVQIFVDKNILNPRDETDPAEVLIAHMQAAFGKVATETDDYPIPSINSSQNKLKSFEVGSSVVRPPDMEYSEKAYAWLPLKLRLHESVSDPFA